jgi:CBS domain-containing protein
MAQVFPPLQALMTPRPVPIDPDDPVALAEAAMRIGDARHVPVARRGRLLGVLSLRDLLAAEPPLVEGDEADDWREQMPVSHVMSRPPIVAQRDTQLGEAAALMLRYHISCLPIVERGRLLGMVTASDLVRRAAERLERAARLASPIPVARLMTSAPLVTIQERDSLDVAELLMRHALVRHLPVLDGNRLVGLLAERDVVATLRGVGPARCASGLPARRGLQRGSQAPDRMGRPGARPVGELMARSPLTIGPGRSAAAAARMLVDDRIGALPVLHHHRLVGILTGGDFVRYLTTCE